MGQDRGVASGARRYSGSTAARGAGSACAPRRQRASAPTRWTGEPSSGTVTPAWTSWSEKRTAPSPTASQGRRVPAPLWTASSASFSGVIAWGLKTCCSPRQPATKTSPRRAGRSTGRRRSRSSRCRRRAASPDDLDLAPVGAGVAQEDPERHRPELLDGHRLGPLDEDHALPAELVVEQRQVLAVGRRVAQAIEVEVRHRDAAVLVAGGEGERRAGDAALVPERADRAAHERGLSGAHLALDEH